MEQTVRVSRSKASKSVLSSPPLPREHGAWVMLYGPVIPVLIAVPNRLAPTLFLVLAITGLYLARHAAALWLRRHSRGAVTDNNLLPWLAIYCVIAVVGALPLFFVYGLWNLLVIGAVACVIWLLHSALQLWPSRKRLDRSQWGEALGASALSLSAPAAWICNALPVSTRMWLLWLVCSLFFGGGIFFVKMLLGAAKEKNAWQPAKKWTLSRDLVFYHVFTVGVLMGVVGFFDFVAPDARWVLMLAFAPAFARAAWGICKLSPILPPLVKVGIREMLLSFWFLFWLGMALREHF
jgi:hypothetical protein